MQYTVSRTISSCEHFMSESESWEAGPFPVLDIRHVAMFNVLDPIPDPYIKRSHDGNVRWSVYGGRYRVNAA